MANFFESLIEHPSIHRLGLTLMHFVWQGVAVATLTGFALFLLRRRSANSRYCASVVALMAMAVLPLVTFCVLDVPAAIDRAESASMPAADSFELQPSAGSKIDSAVNGDELISFDERIDSRPLGDVSSGGVNQSSVEIGPTDQLPPDASIQLPSISWSDRLRTILPWFAVVWSVGVVFLSIRLTGGWVYVGRLKRFKTRPVNRWLHEAAARLGSQMRIGRAFTLWESAMVSVPCVVGCWRPVVLFPASVLTGLPREQIESLLAHELAHIRRHDDIVNALQRVIETLLFYHPAVWWLSKHIHDGRENCCDDLVVAVVRDRLVYAQALASLAEYGRKHAQFSAAASDGDLLFRIRRLMGLSSPRPTRPFPGWAGALLLTMLAVAATLLSVERGTQSVQADQNKLAAGEPAPQATRSQSAATETTTASRATAAPNKADKDADNTDRFGDPIPDGALVRLGTVRLRQRQGVMGVAFTPDGTAFASTGWGDSIRLWDRKTGKQIRHFTGTERNITFAVAFSPDGQKMASVGNKGLVRLWDVKSEKELFKTQKHTGRTYGVAFAPDGKTFATAGGDGSILLWDVTTGVELRSFRQPNDQIRDNHAVAFSSDGKTLAAGSGKTIRLWNLETDGKPLVIENAHRRLVVSITFTPDAKTLISSGCHYERVEPGLLRAVGQIRYWDANTGKQLQELQSEDSQLGLCSLAISSDGTILASGHNDGIRIWDAKSGKLVRTIAEHQTFVRPRTHGLAISPDGKTLAVRASDSAVRLFDVATGKPLLYEPESHTNVVLSVRYSPDGKTIATGSADATVRLWNPSNGEQVDLLLPQKFWVRSVLFTPDGKTLIAGCEAQATNPSKFYGAVSMFNVETGRKLREFYLPDRLMAAALSADGKLLAAATGLGVDDPDDSSACIIHILNVATGKKLAQLRGHSSQVMQMAFPRDGKHLVSVSEDQTARRWNVADGKQEKSFAIISNWSSALSPDGEFLLTGNQDRMGNGKYRGTIHQWDLATGKQRLVVEIPGSVPGSMAISPNGRIVASCLQPLFDSDRPFGGSIILWETATGRELMKFQLDDGRAASLAFSPDGKTLVTGMDRGTALTWDVTAAHEKLKP